MAISFYNTLTRKKEEFKPLKKGEVNLYSCGPTVYNYAHIGNLRAFVFFDVLRRYLTYKGLKVNHVMNITDIDDKTIKGSQKEKKTLEEFTRFYEDEFFKDLERLRIHKKKFLENPRATETMKEMVVLIQDLVKKKHAYKADDGSIYFKISSFKDYGKLAHLDLKHLKAGASGRVAADEYDKESVQDFALWKAYDEKDGDVFWPKKADEKWWPKDFPKGRPGWHIECSAMSMKFLGEQLDIHTGGIDLIFPHHQNEIAQSEAHTHKQFAKYWMHCEHLLVDNKKMSKSLGNFYTLRDVLAKGYKPEAVRYLLLAAHYRSKLNFTFEGLESAESIVSKLNYLITILRNQVAHAVGHGEEDSELSLIIEKSIKEFQNALDNDLDMPLALQAIFKVTGRVNILMSESKLSYVDASNALSFLRNVNEVLDVMTFEEEKLPKELQKLIDDREVARKGKDWEKSDRLRDLLKEKGIEVKDTKDGPVWKRL